MNKNVVIENAKIGFRNFSGKEGRYNPAGRRNFCVFLEEDLAAVLAEDGWNVKYLTPKEEGDSQVPYIQVAVNFSNIPPKIVLITGSGKTILDEDSIDILDWAEIETVDLIIRPYAWEMRGSKGIKGYIKSMYVTIVEDEFEKKYADCPDSAKNTIFESDDIPF